MRLNIPHNAKRFCTCEYLPQKRNHIRKYISFRNPKAELRTNAGKEAIAEVANGYLRARNVVDTEGNTNRL